jgi:hypothetical protein
MIPEDDKRHSISQGPRTENTSDRQNANNLHQRGKKLLERFNGVFTKCLQNYLNWFLAVEKVRNSTQSIQELGLILCTAVHPVEDYINIIKENILIRTE